MGAVKPALANRPVSSSLIPLVGIQMEGQKVAAPFVARRGNGVRGVESNADAAFRNALLAFAPEAPRKHILEALRNGPTGDGGKHAIRYFGADKIQGIAEQVRPLTDAIEIAFATKLGRPGFKQWLNITDFGNDYRMIKGFVAWAELKRTMDAERASQDAASV